MYDEPWIIEQFVVHSKTVSEIARYCNTTNRVRIRNVLCNALDEHEYIELRRRNHRTRIRSKECRKKFAETIASRSASQKEEIRAKLSARYSGKDHPSYFSLSRMQMASLSEMLRHGVGIKAIARALHLSVTKIHSTIIEEKLMTQDELHAYKRKKQHSYPEFLFAEKLKKLGIEHVHGFWVPCIEPARGTRSKRQYDFYLPSCNLLIELDSKTWHDVEHCRQQGFAESHIVKVKESERNDKFKTNLALEKGYQLIRFTDLSVRGIEAAIDCVTIQWLPEMLLEKTVGCDEKNA